MVEGLHIVVEIQVRILSTQHETIRRSRLLAYACSIINCSYYFNTYSMIKIPTLFQKSNENLALVVPYVNSQCQWVLDGEGIATRKFDGTAAAIINGTLYKRYDVKKGKQVPVGAIPCQKPDTITGHWPHWVLVDPYNPEDKYFMQGWSNLINISALEDINKFDGTYELCGPKINGNKEDLSSHELIKHGEWKIDLPVELRTFQAIKQLLEITPWEGIVFHHPDGRMAKIRKSDYGFKR